MKIRRIVLGLVMLGCFIPSAGLAATQTFTFVNNCTEAVTVTITQYPMAEDGTVRGPAMTRTVGPILANGSTSVNRPSGNLVPTQLDATYASLTQPTVLPLKCSGTPVQCIHSFTATFKMSGTMCVMSSDQTVWSAF